MKEKKYVEPEGSTLSCKDYSTYQGNITYCYCSCSRSYNYYYFFKRNHITLPSINSLLSSSNSSLNNSISSLAYSLADVSIKLIISMFTLPSMLFLTFFCTDSLENPTPLQVVHCLQPYLCLTQGLNLG